MVADGLSEQSQRRMGAEGDLHKVMRLCRIRTSGGGIPACAAKCRKVGCSGLTTNGFVYVEVLSLRLRLEDLDYPDYEIIMVDDGLIDQNAQKSGTRGQ